MTENAHESFEIAIERELHGALDPADAKSLAEHLLGCASCRAYQRTAMEMNMDMTATSNLLSRGIVVEALTERVQARFVAEARRYQWVRVALGLVFLVGALVYRRADWATGVGAVLYMALFGGWSYARYQRRELTKNAELLDAKLNEPFETQRRELDRQLKLLMLGWAAFVIGAAWFVVFLVLPPDHGPYQRMTLLAVMWVGGIFSLATKHRDLRRERAALGDR